MTEHGKDIIIIFPKLLILKWGVFFFSGKTSKLSNFEKWVFLELGESLEQYLNGLSYYLLNYPSLTHTHTPPDRFLHRPG